jgi:hypothetical protein
MKERARGRRIISVLTDLPASLAQATKVLRLAAENDYMHFENLIFATHNYVGIPFSGY